MTASRQPRAPEPAVRVEAFDHDAEIGWCPLCSMDGLPAGTRTGRRRVVTSFKFGALRLVVCNGCSFGLTDNVLAARVCEAVLTKAWIGEYMRLSPEQALALHAIAAELEAQVPPDSTRKDMSNVNRLSGGKVGRGSARRTGRG